jgi:23S rRNA pseudouridine1911/1915/1917 synthase
MAVRAGGRRAVTRIEVLERYGSADRPAACLAGCRLETGRTHQIRVHCAHIGHALIGDPVYGRAQPPGRRALGAEAAEALHAFPRQALHAARLGFRHPVTRTWLEFDAAPPSDMTDLLEILRRNGTSLR